MDKSINLDDDLTKKWLIMTPKWPHFAAKSEFLNQLSFKDILFCKQGKRIIVRFIKVLCSGFFGVEDIYKT